MKHNNLEAICNIHKKIVESSVRMTLSKYVKVGEYIQALLMPQFNMPTLSKMDYDTLSPAVTGNYIYKKDKFKYR